MIKYPLESRDLLTCMKTSFISKITDDITLIKNGFVQTRLRYFMQTEHFVSVLYG